MAYSQVALQAQSVRAESGTGGALELRCCDVSGGCSVAFLYANQYDTVLRPVLPLLRFYSLNPATDHTDLVVMGVF